MAPVKLPRYVMLKGDNGYNLCLYPTEGHPYLCFNSTNRDLWGAHEVVPLPGREGVVMIKSLYNSQWWRRSPNWIWADRSQTPSANDTDCLFKVVQVSPNKVALQCLANQRYVKRFTDEGKTSALNANAADYNTDITAQMEVSEALLNRRVFDVEYQVDLVQTTNMKPLLLGKTTAKNNTSSKSDLSVAFTYEVSETNSWRDSTSFTTGLSVTVTAGKPDTFSVGLTVSKETTSTTEMGKENTVKKSLTSTFTVKDIGPGDEVTVTLTATEATGTVPYKYKYQDTRVDGLTMPVDTGVDGIFKGVKTVDIKCVATDSSGAQKPVVPVDKK